MTKRKNWLPTTNLSAIGKTSSTSGIMVIVGGILAIVGVLLILLNPIGWILILLVVFLWWLAHSSNKSYILRRYR